MRIHVEATRIVQALMLVTALALYPFAAQGQLATCVAPGTGDADGDGWLDNEECLGITLRAPLSVRDPTGAATTVIPTCDGTGLPRAFCMHPDERDLFVILVRAVPTQLPPFAELFEIIGRPTGQGGMGVTTHEVFGADPAGSRLVGVGSSQNALRFVEDLNADGDTLGFANYGTPNNLDRGTLWPVRIQNFVASVCGAGPCETDRGANGIAEVSDALLKWVANHEAGHMLKLTRSYDKRFGGFHLKAGTGAVMEQFVTYSTSRKTGTTTFFIPVTYSADSLADATISEGVIP